MSNELMVVIPTSQGEITVTKDQVKNYLCPRADDGEIYMFMQLCLHQRLNPFLREAYLVKYDDKSPAQIVVAKEVFMRRAESCKGYQGFRAGIVLKGKDGKLEEREGSLYTQDDTLVGGWAEVIREDRKTPIKITVGLREYDKEQSTWKNKKGTMIRKVAIVQAFREAFPEDLKGMYIEDEFTPGGAKASPAYEIPEGILSEIRELSVKLGYNDAQLNMRLAKYKGREKELLDELHILAKPKGAVVLDGELVPEDGNKGTGTTGTQTGTTGAVGDPGFDEQQERGKLVEKILALKEKLTDEKYQEIRQKYPTKTSENTIEKLKQLVNELEEAEKAMEAAQ